MESTGATGPVPRKSVEDYQDDFRARQARRAAVRQEAK